MPRRKLTAEEVQDDAEKLFLEQAKAYYRHHKTLSSSGEIDANRLHRSRIVCATSIHPTDGSFAKTEK